MIKMPVSELQPGMKLSKDVCLDDGKILLLADFVIKSRYIRKLESFGVPYVYIYEQPAVHVNEISEEKVYAEAFSTIKSVLTSVRDGNDLDVTPVKDTVDDIVQKVMNNESVFMQLTGIRDIDNYTFLHSVDVCIYALITGKNMGLTKDNLTELGISAILHDIGKCKIPHEILLKPGKLTNDEFHIMKLHTIYGLEIISNTPGLNKRIANVACQHHEKWDGTGYPLGLKGYDIDKFARIITIADIYDALTAERVYKRRFLPHEAAEYLMENTSTLLDPEITEIFLNNIAIYPEGSIVLLNTGEIGSVVDSRKRVSTRPKVRIITRKEGPPVYEPYTIDLMEDKSIQVVDILG